MAENVTNKIRLDTSEFKKSLSEVNANLRNLGSQIKYAAVSTQDYNSRITLLNNVIDENVKKEELLEKQYNELKNAREKDIKAIVEAQKKLYDQKTATELARQELKKFTDAHDESKKSEEAHKIQMELLSRALYDFTKALAEKACKALVDFTKETVNAGLQFETAFAGVKKVVDGTSEDFANLQEEIRKTATEKPISADTLASLYQAGAQLGIEKDNLKDFTNAIIDLQNTSDLTAEAGATMLAQYANVMHLPSEDYEKFASTLSYLGSTTATTESRIMEMAQRMSGAGSSIGMTHQGLLALATAMGSVGIEAEMGGSAISTIMLNIDSAVAKSNDKLLVWAETAGMTADEFSKLWKTDVTGAIQAVLKGLSDEKAGGESLILTLEELGINNIRQKQTMLQLSSASDMLTETINKANEEWKNNTFLAESSNKVYETTANQIELLKNSFKEIQLSIYDDLAKPLQEVTKEMTEFLKSDEAKKFSKDFAKALADMGKTATTVIKWIINNFDKICIAVKTAIPIIGGLATKFLALKTVDFAKNIINDVKNLIAGLSSAIVAQNGLNVAMSANPVGLITTGISLLVTALMGLNTILDATSGGLSKIERQIQENNIARAEEIASIDSEYNHYDDLLKELQTLVDENGNVKAGYEERVNAIIPLLQNATGEEITLINNQIQGYDDLITKLDEVIAKKRAEAKMSAYEDDYKEALKKEEELANKKKELEDRIKKDEDVINGSHLMGYGGTKSVANSDLAKAKKELKDINAQIADGTDVINKYESMLADYTTTYVNNINKTKSSIEDDEEGKKGNADDGASSGSKGGKSLQNVNATIAKKDKAKTESEILKEGNYTYEELKGLNKKYGDDLKIYAEEMKKGNSAVTVAMVEETKKNLDIVQNKLKEMKNVLGNDSTVSTNIMMTTENDNTEEELEAKKKMLKDTLSNLGTEMKNGNTAITQEMLDQINKAIDQTDAKLQNLKNKYAEIDEDDENSEEVYNGGEEEAHATGGVIYGKGVLDENAIYDNAAKQAQIEADAYRQAELAIQEEQLLANANQDAINKQIATLDPSNLSIYDTTNRLLAEQEQISHAAGLNDNAYKVVDAELQTLNQAKQMALTIDFTSIGLYICQGIANGINANKYLVIDAVRAMMEEANEVAEDEEDIESPSKVFKKYGFYIDKGLELGIKDNADGPINNIRDMMASMNSVAAGKLSGLGENVSNTIKRTNSDVNGYSGNENMGQQQVNYTFNQYNTSPKSLDTLALYKDSKSLLKRAVRDKYV